MGSGHDLERWHDFYLAIAGGAATLVGLLFVALSYRLELVKRLREAEWLALQTFTNFLGVFFAAIAALSPLGDRHIALILMALNTSLLVASAFSARQELRGTPAATLAYHFAPNFLTRAALVGAAGMLWLGHPLATLALAVASAAAVGFAARNAWNLLVRLGEYAQRAAK